LLNITGLKKIYNSNTDNFIEAVRDINLDISDQGFYSILGKSGSGKSTLLYMIAGMESYTKGSIKYNGFELSEMSEIQRSYYQRHTIAMIFQDYNIIERLTVYDNIALAIEITYPQFTKREIRERVKEVLKSVDMPNYETKQSNTLSGGEKQRLAIARALAKDSQIILADEPTGNLDSENAKQVLALLNKISKKKLVIMVTHDEEYARDYSDYIIQLVDGKNKQDFHQTSNTSIEDLNRVDSKTKHSLSVRFAMSYIKNQRKKLLLTIIVFIISLSFINLASFYITYNIEEATLRTFDSEKLYKFDLAKDPNLTINSYLSSTEISSLEQLFPNSSFDISYRIRNTENTTQDAITVLGYANYSNPYDTLNIHKIITINQDEQYDYLVGKLPSQYGEILITDYTAYQMIRYLPSFNDFNVEDLIGKVIQPDNSQIALNISGIIKTDYEDILKLVQENRISPRIYFTKLSEEYAVFYMSKATYEVSFGSLDFVSLFLNDGSIRDVKFASSNMYTEFTLIGNLPTQESEIVICLNYVDTYIDSSLIPGSLTNHYDEIQQLLGVEIVLDYPGNSFNQKTYTVVGIFDDYDQNSQFTFMVSPDEFERLVYENQDSSRELYLHVNVDPSEQQELLKYAMNHNLIHISIFSDQLYLLQIGIVTSSVIVLALGIVFAVIGLLLIVSFISINLTHTKKEIGILLSLGFRKKQIIEIYAFIWGILLAISYMISVGLSFILAYLQNKALADYWNVIIKVFYINFTTVMLSGLFSLLFLVVSTIFSLTKIMKIESINIIRGT